MEKIITLKKPKTLKVGLQTLDSLSLLLYKKKKHFLSLKDPGFPLSDSRREAHAAVRLPVGVHLLHL